MRGYDGARLNHLILEILILQIFHLACRQQFSQTVPSSLQCLIERLNFQVFNKSCSYTNFLSADSGLSSGPIRSTWRDSTSVGDRCNSRAWLSFNICIEIGQRKGFGLRANRRVIMSSAFHKKKQSTIHKKKAKSSAGPSLAPGFTLGTTRAVILLFAVLLYFYLIPSVVYFEANTSEGRLKEYITPFGQPWRRGFWVSLSVV